MTEGIMHGESMGAITNKQATQFADEDCRAFADLVESADRTAEALLLNYERDFKALPSVVQAAGEDVVAGGGDEDARSEVKKSHVESLVEVALAIRGCLSVDGRRETVHLFTVNSAPAY